METGPEFLFPPQLLDKQPEQLSLHSQRTKPSPSPSLLAGLIQWCVLAPLVPKTKAERKTEMENNCAKEELTTSLDFDSLMAKLHADLLSVVLSHSKSFRPHSLTSDSVAVIVAALLGFNQQRCVREGSAGMGVRMNEAVERLSQFLQISLSTGILVLKPGPQQLHFDSGSLFHIPYSTYYKPMMYYKPTPLFSSKFLHCYRTRYIIYKLST